MTLRNMALLAFDGVSLLVAAASLLLVTPTPALAYVDPSVMTYTIQALAGVAVALSAVLGVALRRTRRILMRALHIDENAHKQVDPAVHRVDPATEGGVSALAAADSKAVQDCRSQLADAQPKDLSWLQRFWRALLASVFLIGTLFVVAPLEIVAGSTSSLLFEASDVAPLLIGAGLLMSFVLALAASAIKGKAFDMAIAIIVSLGFSCYLQALLFNRSLPIADGQALDLSSHKTVIMISTAAWAVCIGGLVALCLKKVRVCRAFSMALCALLIIIQGAGVASLMLGDSEGPMDITVTKEGLYEVGSDENIIVFVLDTFDTAQMNHLLEEDPAVLDEFTGFTYFVDSAGSMIPTRYGIPFLLTGRMPDGSQSYNEFTDEWYAQSTLLPDLKDAGYSLGIYTDSIEASYMGIRDIEGMEFVNEYADNLHERDEVDIDPWGAIAILDKVALYRDAPWLLKPLFWFYTEDVNNGVISKDVIDKIPYAMDDAAYAEELYSKGLAVGDASRSFRFIHLNGAHLPYTIDATGHETSEGTDLDQQSRGSLAMVEEYLRELKRLGLYDQSTIIITADHGDWYLTPDAITAPTSPIMLVKPSEDSEQAAAPLKVSYVPTGHLDYAATLVAAAGGDSSAYGPTVFEVAEGHRPRYYWMTTSDGHNDQELKQFVIDGNVLDFGNWALTGVEIPVKPEEILANAA